MRATVHLAEKMGARLGERPFLFGCLPHRAPCGRHQARKAATTLNAAADPPHPVRATGNFAAPLDGVTILDYHPRSDVPFV